MGPPIIISWQDLYPRLWLSCPLRMPGCICFLPSPFIFLNSLQPFLPSAVLPFSVSDLFSLLMNFPNKSSSWFVKSRTEIHIEIQTEKVYRNIFTYSWIFNVRDVKVGKWLLYRCFLLYLWLKSKFYMIVIACLKKFGMWSYQYSKRLFHILKLNLY